jgi:hypothetical protein
MRSMNMSLAIRSEPTDRQVVCGALSPELASDRAAARPATTTRRAA